ncbi:MAG: AAA family ATPase [Burkholderiales bacterium]|nr:AAA family ATPase [Burkholderiales bacterium]
MRPSHVRAVLEREFRAAAEGVHTPVMVWGPPGVGKSRIVAEIALRHGVALIDLRLSQMEPTDLRGIPFRVGERVEWSVPSMLPDAERHGERGILFLDEITSAPPTVTAAAYQLILDRRLGEYAIPPAWAIFSAGNRYGDRGVTYVMPSPLANRFTHYEIEPHLDDWVAWANAAALDWRIVAFLRFRPELLFEFDPARNPVAFPSPRSWEYAHRALAKFEGEGVLLLEALQACVGLGCGVEFMAFLDHMQEMPDVDAIARGDSFAVPARLDIQYGVAAALVRRARAAAGGAQAQAMMRNILRYAREFPQREMGVMLVTDMHRTLGQPLYALPEFQDWAQSVSDLLLYDRALPR